MTSPLLSSSDHIISKSKRRKRRVVGGSVRLKPELRSWIFGKLLRNRCSSRGKEHRNHCSDLRLGTLITLFKSRRVTDENATSRIGSTTSNRGRMTSFMDLGPHNTRFSSLLRPIERFMSCPGDGDARDGGHGVVREKSTPDYVSY
jgi:hypothetical protein